PTCVPESSRGLEFDRALRYWQCNPSALRHIQPLRCRVRALEQHPRTRGHRQQQHRQCSCTGYPRARGPGSSILREDKHNEDKNKDCNAAFALSHEGLAEAAETGDVLRDRIAALSSEPVREDI